MAFWTITTDAKKSGRPQKDAGGRKRRILAASLILLALVAGTIAVVNMVERDVQEEDTQIFGTQVTPQTEAVTTVPTSIPTTTAMMANVCKIGDHFIVFV